MTWSIERTGAFLEALKKHKKNDEFLRALDKKIARLQDDPTSVGGMLAGELHGWQSTRLIKNFRLLFRLDEDSQTVFLGAIEHRKHAYQ